MTNVFQARPLKHPANNRSGGVVRRVSIVCGSVMHYDAISECALACLEAAAQPNEADRVEVRIYCLDTNVADSRIHVLKSSTDLLAEQYYQNSDLIIHHFGIFSEIHHTLATAPRSACIVIHFYGVTPPQFMPAEWEQLISSSFIQIGLFFTADEIVVNSTYLREELERMGISVPLRQIDLFGVNIAEKPFVKGRVLAHDGLNVVYCGRLIASKQVIPLLDALESCVDEFKNLTLTLIGVKRYSDEIYLKEIERRASTGRVNVVFALDLNPTRVTDAIGTADLVALPSLHEGFGMPVAEALAALTPVLCSDAGSLPEVTGGLALLFKAGDQQSLNTATENALRARLEGNVLTEQGALSYEDWAKRAQTFAAKYRRSEFVARWQSFIAEKLAKTGPVGLPSTAKVDALEYLFQGPKANSPSEAQLLGRVVMLKTLSRLGSNDVTGAIDALFRWAFGRPADDESLDYWLQVYNRSETIDNVISQMSSAARITTSHLRMRSLAGLMSALTEDSAEQNNDSNSAGSRELPAMSRSQVEYVAQSAENPADFIRSLYANVFKATPDPDGFAYWVNVASDRNNWISVIETFYGYIDQVGSENDGVHRFVNEKS